MKKIGFDNQKYLQMQSEHIKERINMFGGKLYLEFGGKLFDDYHASRVLPGFQPDSKLKMLLQIKEQVEVVMVIAAEDIEKNKVRSDLGITYDQEIIRLVEEFRNIGLYVGSITITKFKGQPAAIEFEEKLRSMGLSVYRHYPIEGYPSNISKIVSEEGFGKNDYIETKRELVVVTAPGPGSGKMATCLSQLYQENKRGIPAGYAKYETFPIWNVPLQDPVNIAYEAATADLDDVNMIDPFHLDAYGKTTVNYNRDVEIFPVLHAMLEKVMGQCPYKSPTDMGVNMAGYCIVDNAVTAEASKQEIIRRYFGALCDRRKGKQCDDVIFRLELLMKKVGVTQDDRLVVPEALKKAEMTGEPASAIMLDDGRIITGKTSELLGCSSAMLLNALKVLGNIDDDVHLISPEIIEPIQKLKTETLGSKNPRLHTDEVLIALSICAATDPQAKIALEQLPKLKDCQAHCTVLLSSVDETVFRKLGVQLTCEPIYQKIK